MKNCKFMVALLCLVLCTSLVFAQKRTETTVEDEYLSTVEGFIITELTNAQDYDSKEKALDFLEEAIKNGRTSPDMEQALHSIAGEGVFHESRTNGRLVNNFPDLRARACALLGEIGDAYSIKTLTEVILSDNEPMVTMAAVKALGNTNIEDPDKAVEVIAWSEKKFAMLNPTPSLADEVLNAYERIAPNLKNNKEMIKNVSEIAANPNYPKALQNKAVKLLKELMAK